MTVQEQNRLSELSHTLKLLEDELKRAEEDLRHGKDDPSVDIKEVSERFCVIVKERYRVKEELDRIVDKLFESLEHEE